MSGLKENNGRAARRQLMKKVWVVLGTALACLVGFLGYNSFFATGSEMSWTAEHAVSGSAYRLRRQQQQKHGRKMMRREKDGESKRKHHQQQQNHDYFPEIDDILSGHLHLIEIYINHDELQESQGERYKGVYATFCRLDWQAHKENPSGNPMFRDLMSHSKETCDRERVENISLHKIAKDVREFDETKKTTTLLKVSGFVFHESRCGSTLAANLLAAVRPEQHRVYSESGPPVTALKACGETYEQCSIETAAAIFRDVIYLMSRSDDPKEQRSFFKIQSIGSRNIATFIKAYENETEKNPIPWMFVYRDPVQVMMSHLKQGKNANCVRPQRSPPQTVEKIVQQYDPNHRQARELSMEEYCAAHLASITESVLQFMNEDDDNDDHHHHHHHHNGVAVNYQELPNRFYTDLFPNHFHINVDDGAMGRLKETAGVYSKGRGHKAGEFKEDSEQKEKMASDEVKAAAQLFLQPSFDKLEATKKIKV